MLLSGVLGLSRGHLMFQWSSNSVIQKKKQMVSQVPALPPQMSSSTLSSSALPLGPYWCVTTTMQVSGGETVLGGVSWAGSRERNVFGGVSLGACPDMGVSQVGHVLDGRVPGVRVWRAYFKGACS